LQNATVQFIAQPDGLIRDLVVLRHVLALVHRLVNALLERGLGLVICDDLILLVAIGDRLRLDLEVVGLLEVVLLAVAAVKSAWRL
jgi:hypothetical protein